ncbi:beclin 1-associated autophagy-related key regulator-like [Watersipora subatra]|uniref:beclin 1-associated autophagy-related key regulator-like n=1 Tax=Watersipora subatra TaxID=2589382 RepID=UPI00355ADD92
MMTEYAQDDKKLKIEKLRERLKSLRLKLDQQIATRIEKLSESKVICRENRKLARFIASSKKKCLSKVSEVQKRKEALLVRQQEIDEMEKDSLARRQRVVKDMGEFMFPVEPVRALSQSNDNLDSVSMELQDASNHQYVKGAWAYVDTAKDFQYTIAGARFYASGECVELRQYLDYTPEQKIASKPTSAHGEWAALSHISQFVQSMAASLDVHVPYMTYIPLLNLGSATSEDLTNFLAQINMNLAVLSASQGIDMHDYFPRRTISNLYHLLNRDYLSRSQQHQLVLTSQIQTVHDDITRPLLYEPLPGEQPEDSNYVIVTESPIIRSSEMISTSYAASASSIMTSAVSAVSSLWPWK